MLSHRHKPSELIPVMDFDDVTFQYRTLWTSSNVILHNFLTLIDHQLVQMMCCDRITASRSAELLFLLIYRMESVIWSVFSLRMSFIELTDDNYYYCVLFVASTDNVRFHQIFNLFDFIVAATHFTVLLLWWL